MEESFLFIAFAIFNWATVSIEALTACSAYSCVRCQICLIVNERKKLALCGGWLQTCSQTKIPHHLTQVKNAGWITKNIFISLSASSGINISPTSIGEGYMGSNLKLQRLALIFL